MNDKELEAPDLCKFCGFTKTDPRHIERCQPIKYPDSVANYLEANEIKALKEEIDFLWQFWLTHSCKDCKDEFERRLPTKKFPMLYKFSKTIQNCPDYEMCLKRMKAVWGSDKKIEKFVVHGEKAWLNIEVLLLDE